MKDYRTIKTICILLFSILSVFCFISGVSALLKTQPYLLKLFLGFLFLVFAFLSPVLIHSFESAGNGQSTKTTNDKKPFQGTKPVPSAAFLSYQGKELLYGMDETFELVDGAIGAAVESKGKTISLRIEDENVFLIYNNKIIGSLPAGPARDAILTQNNDDLSFICKVTFADVLQKRGVVHIDFFGKENSQLLQKRDIISSYSASTSTSFEGELEKIPSVEPVRSNTIAKRRRASDMPGIKTHNITRKTNPEKIFPLVVLDTETTGFQASKNDIIEVSAIKFEYPFLPVASFSALLRPRGIIPAEASAVNGITKAMVSDCPYFGEIVDSFSDFIRGCNIAGHNLPFDLKFLFVGGLDLPENVKYYDTLALAKNTLVKEGTKKYNHHTGEYEDLEEYDVINYKLETLCEYYGIYRNTKHRALSDAYATAKVLQNLIYDKTEISFPKPIRSEPETKTKEQPPKKLKTEGNNADYKDNTDSVMPPETESFPVEPKENKKKNIPGRSIIQLDDAGKTICEFVSIAEASRATGINQKSIRDAANGVQKHAGGFVWRFDDFSKQTIKTEIINTSAEE